MIVVRMAIVGQLLYLVVKLRPFASMHFVLAVEPPFDVASAHCGVVEARMGRVCCSTITLSHRRHDGLSNAP